MYREAESGTLTGAASPIYNPGATAGDHHVYMIGPNASVCWNVTVGIGNLYQVHLASWMTGTNTNKFELYANPGGWLPVEATPTPGWAWHSVERYLYQGEQQICVRTRPNAQTQEYLYIDAVAIGTDT